MIGHMQIRTKHTIILVCKRWGHGTVRVIARVDLCRNIGADLQRRHLLPWSHLLYPNHPPSPFTHFLSCCHFFPFPLPLSIHSWGCFISSPLLIHDSLSVFLPDFDFFFLSSTPSCPLSLICFPNPSTIFLQFCLHLSPSLSRIVSDSLHLSGLPSFIHLKSQLMMNETSLPWAQTWVALWDSGQLPKGRSGLIPYSWAASTPVLLVLCISRDPSLSWHPIFKVNTFLFPHSNVSPISSLFSKQLITFLLPSPHDATRRVSYFSWNYPHTFFTTKAYFKTPSLHPSWWAPVVKAIAIECVAHGWAIYLGILAFPQYSKEK